MVDCPSVPEESAEALQIFLLLLYSIITFVTAHRGPSVMVAKYWLVATAMAATVPYIYIHA